MADALALAHLLHGNETRVWGDQAYRGQKYAMRATVRDSAMTDAEATLQLPRDKARSHAVEAVKAGACHRCDARRYVAFRQPLSPSCGRGRRWTSALVRRCHWSGSASEVTAAAALAIQPAAGRRVPNSFPPRGSYAVRASRPTAAGGRRRRLQSVYRTRATVARSTQRASESARSSSSH